MFLDALVSFVPLSSPLSLVLGAGVSAASNVFDLLGAGVGVAPPNIIGTRSTFGADPGIDDQKTQLLCAVGTAFATSNSATLNVQFQGAVDTGSSGNYQPGTWATLGETGTIAAANLTAGAIIARFDWPPAFPVKQINRFFRLNFVVPSATSFTAGTIAYAYPVIARDDWAEAFAGKNFTVA